MECIFDQDIKASGASFNTSWQWCRKLHSSRFLYKVLVMLPVSHVPNVERSYPELVLVKSHLSAEDKIESITRDRHFQKYLLLGVGTAYAYL